MHHMKETYEDLRRVHPQNISQLAPQQASHIDSAHLPLSLAVPSLVVRWPFPNDQWPPLPGLGTLPSDAWPAPGPSLAQPALPSPARG